MCRGCAGGGGGEEIAGREDILVHVHPSRLVVLPHFMALSLQIPEHGVYEFDFVTARRPSSRTKPLHSLAFYRLLKNAGVYDLLVSVP